MTLDFNQSADWLRGQAEQFAKYAKDFVDNMHASTEAMLADPKTDNAALIQRYHDLNAHLTTLGKIFNAMVPPEHLEKIKAKFLERLIEAKTNSFATDNGTAYKTVLLKGKIIDREKWVDWVLEDWDNRNGMFQVGAPAVKELREYIETNKTAPPGVETSTHTNVNITKG